jgi:expansin (peptidoglycan-binding protein)
MSSLARKPARGNWIWLGGALCAVAAVAGVAVAAAIGGSAGGGTRPAASAPRSHAGPGGTGAGGAGAGGAGAGGSVAGGTGAGGTGGTGSSGRPARRGPGGPGAAGYLAGTPAVAVFYDPGTAVGGCSLGPFPAGGRYVSLPPGRFGHSAACGSYLTVQGPRGQVRAEVVDLCPGCAADMINLSRAAFEVVANPGPGAARVRFWPLADPALPGPLILRAGQTRTGLPTLQVRRHGNALATVAVAAPGAPAPAWHPFTLNGNGIWVADGLLRPGPVTVRITDTRGHQVLIRGVTLRPGQVIRTRTWVYGPGPRDG